MTVAASARSVEEQALGRLEMLVDGEQIGLGTLELTLDPGALLFGLRPGPAPARDRTDGGGGIRYAEDGWMRLGERDESLAQGRTDRGRRLAVLGMGDGLATDSLGIRSGLCVLQVTF